MIVRKAKTCDVVVIQKMLGHFAQQGKLLARSLSELYTNVRDMSVVEGEAKEIIGCCSLHVIWEDLAEIRSLAVLESHQGRGLGRQLVEICMEEAGALGVTRVFTLTYETRFFEHLGFQVVDKNIFPQKIWADCLHCPKFPDCDEIAMLIDV